MRTAGEKIGTGTGMKVDIAVDPLDGTSLVAGGRNGAVAVCPAVNMYVEYCCCQWHQLLFCYVRLVLILLWAFQLCTTATENYVHTHECAYAKSVVLQGAGSEMRTVKQQYITPIRITQ